MATKLLQFFRYGHLAPHLQLIGLPFGVFAQHLEDTLPSNAEKNTALRKLLESRDCAMRATLNEPRSPESSQATTDVFQFFTQVLLPSRVHAASKLFNEFAQHLEGVLPSNAEKNTAMRKLLESRDSAMRALLFDPAA